MEEAQKYNILNYNTYLSNLICNLFAGDFVVCKFKILNNATLYFAELSIVLVAN